MPSSRNPNCPICGRSSNSCRCPTNQQVSFRALPSEAREPFAHLKSELEAKAAVYPSLQHVMIATPNVAAFNEASIGVPFVYQSNHREIRRFWQDKNEIQVFIDADHAQGSAAYEEFWPLAEIAVDTLIALGMFQPSEVPPDPSQPLWFDAKKNHYAKQWMVFVHRLARDRPAALPRSTAAAAIEHFPLKQGGITYTLAPGVFKASALIVQRLLKDGNQQPGKRRSTGAKRASASDLAAGFGDELGREESESVIRDQVFISYSHKDKAFLDDLLSHLKPYVRKGAIKPWSDRQIEPGSKWLDEIKAALASTSVAVMLVSPGFLSSDFIHEHELAPFLKEASTGGVKILWMSIRDCAYQETSLTDYQAVVSPPAKPFAQMRVPQRDTAWKQVCAAIKDAASRP